MVPRFKVFCCLIFSIILVLVSYVVEKYKLSWRFLLSVFICLGFEAGGCLQILGDEERCETLFISLIWFWNFVGSYALYIHRIYLFILFFFLYLLNTSRTCLCQNFFGFWRVTFGFLWAHGYVLDSQYLPAQQKIFRSSSLCLGLG